MKKRIVSLVLAIIVALLFNCSILVSAADNRISSEANVQQVDILNESFIEYDYETKSQTTFTYADVVSSLRKVDSNYTDYTRPFNSADMPILTSSMGDSIRTTQPGSSYNLIDEYKAPYKYTMRIEVIDSDGGRAYGTGFMVSRYVMLTCAHVVWGDDVDEIRIYPFNNKPISSLDNEPYYHPQKWVVTTNYTSATDSETKAHYDWCYLTLHDPLGATTGYYSFASISDSVSNSPVNLTGYPGNNTEIPNFQRYAQYMSEGYLSVINSQRVKHSCSALAGHSGSPVYSAGNVVVAIHTGGGISNYGVRITPTLYNLLVNRINEVG